MVNERAKRRNLLGSFPKLNRAGNSERLSAGPAPEMLEAAEASWKILSVVFRPGPGCLEDALGTPAPSCQVLHKHRTRKNLHTHTASLLAFIYALNQMLLDLKFSCLL